MVGKLHSRVHNAFALDNNLNLILRQAKQPDSLNQLQTFVHQGGGIDRDLSAHIPVGVLEGIRLGFAAQLLGRHTKERSVWQNADPAGTGRWRNARCPPAAA